MHHSASESKQIPIELIHLLQVNKIFIDRQLFKNKSPMVRAYLCLYSRKVYLNLSKFRKIAKRISNFENLNYNWQFR